MNTVITWVDGKFVGVVHNGGAIVYRSQRYYTQAMALADAKCWAAFHGGNQMHELVEAGASYYITDLYGGMHVVTAEDLSQRIERALGNGIEVTKQVGTGGVEYINFHKGDSSYARWFKNPCECGALRTVTGPCGDDCKHALHFQMVARHSRSTWTDGNWAGE